MLRSALRYGELGVPVVLLAPGSKVPLLSKRAGGNGVLDATTDPKKITAQWTRHPHANIGGATGRSSLLGVVVDIDPAHGGDDSLARLERRHGVLHTLEGYTATGGRHLVFGYPANETLRNTAGQVGDGIDSRADGGYVVLPPSVRQEGRYRWVNWATAPAELPDWLLTKLRKPTPPPPVPVPRASLAFLGDGLLRQKAEAVATARDKTRNATLNASAYYLGRFVAAGALDELEVVEVLTAAAQHAGLEEREIPATIQSGLIAGMARPRST